MSGKSVLALAALLVGLAISVPPAVAQPLSLITITNNWKYDQSGADLSGQFNRTGFDDSGWASGKGLLGLETSAPYPYPYPILTPLTVGGGRITYYFRTHFNFPTNPVGVILTSTDYVDDGAVYYLNGAEVGRVRIAAGAVTAATLAANVTPEGQATVLNFPADSLAEGDNVLAVEVHQTAATSSDIVFGTILTAILPAPGPVTITNQPPSQTVNEGDIVTFAAEITGSPPYFFQWFNNGSRLANATNQSYVIISVTTNDAGNYSFTVSNLFSSAVSGNATLSVNPAPYAFVPMTNVWKYNGGGTNLGTAWRAVAYNDAGWPSGAALFYNESAALPAPKNTFLPLNNSAGQFIITYYLRTHFTWPMSPAGATLTARTLIDDGAVIYLNGVEAARVGMPAAPTTIAYNTLANRTIGDANIYQVIPLANNSLVQGDNVLAVEVHQVSTASSDVVFGLALGTNFPVTLPDLMIWGPSAFPHTMNYTFGQNDCEVQEGCGIPGARRLLIFDTETRNVGRGDLILGDPAGNPLFQYSSCHMHYHFLGFAEYRLLDSNGARVATGNKVGFCLEDLQQVDPAANPEAVYDCGYQGIQHGWADIYNAALPCQWIDITGVPPGTYTLEMEIDPDNRIAESNETNNTTRVTLTIEEPCTTPPPNDTFSGAEVIPYRIASATGKTECATKEPSEPDHAGNAGGGSIWFRWTAPSSGTVVISTDGSDFDTLLAVYRGSALNNLTLVASDDDGGAGYASLISATLTAGTVYQIAVDGYGGAAGNVVLNINPGANNPFASCLAISGASGTVTGNNSDATKEAGEPNHAGDAGGHSVWYCWTANTSGPVSFDTLGSRFDTLLAVYTGTAVGSLTPVASNNDSGPNGASRVVFDTVAGTLYRIAVDGLGGASGVFKLSWQPSTPTRFTAAVPLPGELVRFKLAGLAGDRYLIQTSSNLVNWIDSIRLTNLTGTVEFIEPAGIIPHQQFYRARLAP